MPRGVSTDAKHFREILTKGVILKEAASEGDIDVDGHGASPVYVAIVVNATGYGPHLGMMYAYQNRFHAGPDSALQEAFEMLEEWERKHNRAYWDELVEEHGNDNGQADEAFTETFDGWVWKLDPKDFAKAIQGTKASKSIKIRPRDHRSPVLKKRKA